MAMEKNQYVVIGNEYAKVCGYQELVGALGIIDDVMDAMCGVTIMSGHPDYIGKQVDIHKGDCLLQQNEASVQLYAVADFIGGHIYYSQDRELVHHTAAYIGMNQTQTFEDFTHVHEVLDELFARYAFKRQMTHHGYVETREPMDWIAASLDDETCDATKYFRENYQANKEATERLHKQGIEIELAVQKKVASLTEQFKSQLYTRMHGPSFIDVNEKDDAGQTSDSPEDDGLAPC